MHKDNMKRNTEHESPDEADLHSTMTNNVHQQKESQKFADTDSGDNSGAFVSHEPGDEDGNNNCMDFESEVSFNGFHPNSMSPKFYQHEHNNPGHGKNISQHWLLDVNRKKSVKRRLILLC